MRLSVSNLQELVSKKMEPMIRFSLTVLDDSGESLWTSKGWRLTADETILPPASGYMVFHEVTDRFLELLKAALKTYPGVKRILAEREEQIARSIPTEELVGKTEIEL